MPPLKPPSPASPAFRCHRAMAVFVSVFLVALVADLTLKAWAFEHVAAEPISDGLIEQVVEGKAQIPPHPGIGLAPYILKLRLTVNRGAVFGLWQGKRAVFILATVVAIGLIGYFFAISPARNTLFHVALALILAGALGNLYDRIRFQCVRDMLYLFPGVKLPFGWRWMWTESDELYPWIFNLADAALLAGIALALWRSHRPGIAADGDKPVTPTPTEGPQTP